MPKRWLAALAGLLAAASLLFSSAGLGQVAVPALIARVTDLTGTLTPEQKSSLEQRLAAFEARKGSQVAVLMLPTTKPEEIEQFGIRVGEAWKIGRKGTDDGVILIVAKEDRRLRIEVGYGLEGVISDAVAKRVISETITPKFKTGDFYGGVSDGVDRITKLIDGEKLPPPTGSATSSPAGAGGKDPTDYLVFAFFFVLVGGGILRAMFGRFGGAALTGGAMGLLGFFLFGATIALIAAIVGFILALLNVGSLANSMGSSGSGGFSSGSSGGSSWGGGGGSFGGGGSSGSW